MYYLNYDIYETIIQIGINENILKFSDLRNLKHASRMFYYNIVDEKYFKILAYKIMSKHLKNCRNKLLYTFYNEKRTINGYDSGSLKALKLLINPCLPKFHFDLNDVGKILLPSFIDKLYVKPINKIKSSYIVTEITIPNYGDIVSSFIILGKNIKKVELIIGGCIIHSQHFINAGMINFQPIVNGIYLIALMYHEVKIRVYSESLEKVYCRYILLDTDRLFLAGTNHIVNINNYKTKNITCGMMI